jgi:hypothetical protein
MLTILALGTSVHGREFFCAGGDSTCLFESITEAKFNAEANTIFLDNGTYTGLQLPSIAGPLPMTIIGEDPNKTIITGSDGLSTVFFITPEGNLTLDGLTVTSATATGIHNLGTLTANNLRVISNSNFSSGGGISNSGVANIANSSIDRNFSVDSSGGGISNSGTMTINGSTIVHNQAGGMFTSGNGIVNSGTLHITNTTIARNTRIGEVQGGGIHNLGFLTLTNTTITENSAVSGGGIFNLDMVELRNTILAGNTGGFSSIFDPGGPECGGTVISLGNNRFGDLTNCTVNLQPSDTTGNPGLLGEYTEDSSIPGSGHYPLIADSPAIDAGSPEVCWDTDQLEKPRLGICDVGSVEFTGETAGNLLVDIDVRPSSGSNIINPDSTKNINVAVFSRNGFDPSVIDVNTVRFGATGTETAPINVARREVNGDGTRDLVLRFAIQDLSIQCGDVSVTLKGRLADGQSFSGSTPIRTKCGTQQQTVSIVTP